MLVEDRFSYARCKRYIIHRCAVIARRSEGRHGYIKQLFSAL
jgi:hypothetical protein